MPKTIAPVDSGSYAAEILAMSKKPQQGNYSDKMPPWLQYLTQQYLKNTPAQKMAYLEGWQLNPSDPNYNMGLAYLTGVQPHPQPEDMGPAGPRYHFASKTPGGQWLKSPTHPTHWREDFAQLQQMFEEAKKGKK